jgi:hypothetical protein
MGLIMLAGYDTIDCVLSGLCEKTVRVSICN